MKITNIFIELISINKKINSSQMNILNISKLNSTWSKKLIGKEISDKDANLLILLAGDISPLVQDIIIGNYYKLLGHKSINSEPVINNKIGKLYDITIYCDGACTGNPGESGSGIAYYNKNKSPILYYGGYVENGTNNIAELQALKKSLELAIKSSSNKVLICSDSKYAIESVTKWSYGWSKSGWRKKTGDIKNLELIKDTHILYDSIKNKVTIKWVRGHSGIEGNELADRMAVYTIKIKNSSFLEYKHDNINKILLMKSF